LQTQESDPVSDLSQWVPGREPQSTNHVYRPWHSIYQENADLFSYLACTEDTMDR